MQLKNTGNSVNATEYMPEIEMLSRSCGFLFVTWILTLLKIQVEVSFWLHTSPLDPFLANRTALLEGPSTKNSL